MSRVRRGITRLRTGGGSGTQTLGGTGTGTVPSVPAGAINIKNAPYNATGNGTTDDGAAIRAAYAAAGSSGATVYFPTGNYRYVATGSLQLNTITTQGDGQTASVILYECATDYVPIALNTGNNVAWKSLQIKRNSPRNVVLFPARAMTGWTFDNVLLDGNRAIDNGATDVYGFQLGATGTLLTTKLLNSTFKNFSQFPLFQASSDAGTTDGFEVRNCVFRNNYHTHLEFNGPSSGMQNLTIENNSFIDQFGPAAGGFGAGFANCKHVTFRYNLVQNTTQEGVHVEDRSDDVLIEFNKFIQCATGHFSSIQIVSASNNVRAQKNVIDGTGTKDGQYIAAIAALGGGGANPTNITITDNTIDPGTNDGIYHQCAGVTITNNRFSATVKITNGGSSGAVTVSGNTVSTANPVGFPA